MMYVVMKQEMYKLMKAGFIKEVTMKSLQEMEDVQDIIDLNQASFKNNLESLTLWIIQLIINS